MDFEILALKSLYFRKQQFCLTYFALFDWVTLQRCTQKTNAGHRGLESLSPFNNIHYFSNVSIFFKLFTILSLKSEVLQQLSSNECIAEIIMIVFIMSNGHINSTNTHFRI